MADQQVTQFQPTFSPAQQGLGSIQQAPDTPAMESTPQDYYSQYAPTQQYDAPAASPMTAGLGSYMEGLKYQAPPPPPPPPPAAPAARNYSWNSGKYADEAALRGALGTYATQNNYTPASVDTWMGDQATYGISSTPAAPAATSTATAYNPQTQQYTAPTAPVEPVAPAQTAQEIAFQKFKAEQDEINAIMSTQGGSAAGGRIHAYAQGGSIPQGIASLGRGQDSMLVHMTPGEVHGLQQLAMAHGGSLTINPQTGLPEAGFLSSILPMVGAGIGIALAPATGGASLYAMGGGALGGMLGSSMEGKSPLMGGLMGGISGYGMGGLGEAFAGMGAETLTGSGVLPFVSGVEATMGGLGAGVPPYVPPVIAPPAVPLSVDASTLASSVAQQPPPVIPFDTNVSRSLGYADMGNYDPTAQLPPVAPGASPVALPDVVQSPVGYESLGYPAGVPEIPEKFGMSRPEGPLTTTDTGMMGGFRQATSSPGAAGEFLKKNYKSVAMAGAPLLMGLSALGGKTALPGKTPAQYYSTSYSPGTVNPRFGQPGQPYFLGQGYGPGSYSTAYAEGGDVHDATSGYAEGGIASLDTYAAGGKLLQGPGDGMSDSIPAVIQGKRPQRAALAQGEFVIPADVVSHLGNGSTDAGSKRLYAMMDKVRKARTGNPKQGKQINPDRFLPA